MNMYCSVPHKHVSLSSSHYLQADYNGSDRSCCDRVVNSLGSKCKIFPYPGF